MFLIQRIDPYLNMGEDNVDRVTDLDAARTIVESNYDYWAGMVTTDPANPAEFPLGTRVTLNVDDPAAPSVWFLCIHYPDGYQAEPGAPSHQVDLYFLIRDDTDPEGDISFIDGAQCGDCGRINCAPVGATEKPDDVVPVWRTHPETVNGLCDDCADKRYGALATSGAAHVSEA